VTANQWAEAERGRADRAERHLEDERKMLDELQTALADAVVAQRIARRRSRSLARRLCWALRGR
jgi:hypothetical protein